MKALITGGAGFLGSHLARALLSRGDEVVVLDDISGGKEEKIHHLKKYPKFTFIRDSILNEGIMDILIKKCDIIFHFAAVVGVEHYVVDPYSVLNINVNGTQLVLKLAHKYDKKVVFASSSEVYGKNPHIPYKEEDDRVLGSTKIDRWSYSTSKAVGEHFCFAYHKIGLSVVVLRFFNVYGPFLDSLDTGRVITIFLGQILRGKPVTVIGDGMQTRCFTYVDDIIRGILLAASNKKAEGEILNLGTNVETTIKDLAKTMIRIAKSKSKIQHVSYKNIYKSGYEDIQRRVPDISKAQKILGFKAKISLEDGLAKTIDWFRKRGGF